MGSVLRDRPGSYREGEDATLAPLQGSIFIAQEEEGMAWVYVSSRGHVGGSRKGPGSRTVLYECGPIRPNQVSDKGVGKTETRNWGKEQLTTGGILKKYPPNI